MTIWPRNYTKETGWVHTGEPATAPREKFLYSLNMHWHKIILQLPTKWLNPTDASLFDILPSDILADIDIWVSSLEHWNKFKPFISCFKYMSNPVIFSIPYKLCTMYLNFGAFCWYNQVKYDLAHRSLLSRYYGNCAHYEYYTNASKYITQLTPELL